MSGGATFTGCVMKISWMEVQEISKASLKSFKYTVYSPVSGEKKALLPHSSHFQKWQLLKINFFFFLISPFLQPPFLQ